MNAKDILESVLAGVAIVTIVAGVLAFGILSLRMFESLQITLTHPYSLSYTGGFLAYYISHPLQLYQPTDPIPYPTIYPPLVPLLIPDLPGISVYRVARAVNWLAIAANGGLIAYLGRNYTDRLSVGLVAAMLYVLSSSVMNATVLLRVDHLALTLTLATLAVFVADRSLWLVGVLAVAAGFAKQPYAIYAIAPVMFSLWMQGKRHQSLWFAASTAAAGLSLLGLLALVTNGWAIKHLLLFNASVPWIAEVLLAQVHTFLYTHGLLVGIGWGIMLTLDDDGWQHPIPWLFVFAVLLGLMTVGKEGAWVGYFYPLIASGAILSASAVPVYDYAADQSVRKRAVSTVVILLLVSQLWMYTLWQPQPQKPLDGQAAVADWMADVDEPVIAEDPSVAPGHGPPVDVLMVQGLIERDVIDGDPLAEALACGRWEYVITWIRAVVSNYAHSRWTRAQVDAIESNYEVVSREHRWWVHRYNGTPTCRPTA